MSEHPNDSLTIRIRPAFVRATADVDSLLQSGVHSVCRGGSGNHRVPACSGCGGRLARGWRGRSACMAAHSQGRRRRAGRWGARSRCGSGLRGWSRGGGSGAGHDAQAGSGCLAAWRRPTAAHVRGGCRWSMGQRFEVSTTSGAAAACWSSSQWSTLGRRRSLPGSVDAHPALSHAPFLTLRPQHSSGHCGRVSIVATNSTALQRSLETFLCKGFPFPFPPLARRRSPTMSQGQRTTTRTRSGGGRSGEHGGDG